MALDGAYLHIIMLEIERAAIGARIDKIHQPSREEIILVLRYPGGTKKLLISAAADSPRIHFVENPPDNPKSPPMFCMLMRKHLGSGRLSAVRQLELDRVLYLDFDTTNEFGDMVTLTLAVEIMGRHSNIILIGADGVIIDSVKRVDATMSEHRQVMPGIGYTIPPKQDKQNLLNCDIKSVLAKMKETPLPLAKAVMQTFMGISPILAREAEQYAGRGYPLQTNMMSGEQWERLEFYIQKVKEKIETGNGNFTAVFENGRPRDFSFVNIEQYGTYAATKQYGSPSELLDDFYYERDRQERVKQRTGGLLKRIMTMYGRVERKIDAMREELLGCENREIYKIYGDLLSTNQYMLQKGMKEAVLQNYYDENGGDIKIPLDGKLTPMQNASQYYKMYKKAATAEKILMKRIEQAKTELIYLDSVFDAASRASAEEEISEIRQELFEEGYGRRERQKGKALKALPPLRFTSSDGFAVLCGRNNKQNDKLTMKTAKAHDLWLHAKDIPGSHVIVVTNGETPPDRTIEEAAEIAAYYSKAGNGAQVPVNYTPVKFVKKPAGAKPGMVIFSEYQTAFVNPDRARVEALRD